VIFANYLSKVELTSAMSKARRLLSFPVMRDSDCQLVESIATGHRSYVRKPLLCRRLPATPRILRPLGPGLTWRV
jgi:hypothetical protein